MKRSNKRPYKDFRKIATVLFHDLDKLEEMIAVEVRDKCTTANSLRSRSINMSQSKV